MLYRVQQFISAITAKVTDEERQWVIQKLSLEEQKLFWKLKLYEQRHCIDVARVLEQQSNEGDRIIRLGLLHDIGKINYPLNPIEKSLIVILDKLTKGRIKKYKQLKMVQCYYGHAEAGYRLLKNIGGYDEAFLECIRGHHQGSQESETLRLLIEADNRC